MTAALAQPNSQQFFGAFDSDLTYGSAGQSAASAAAVPYVLTPRVPTALPPQLAYYAKTPLYTSASVSAPALAAAPAANPSDYYSTGTRMFMRPIDSREHVQHHAQHQHQHNHRLAHPAIQQQQQQRPSQTHHQHHPNAQPAFYESEIKTVIEAPSTRIIVRDFAPVMLRGNTYARLVSSPSATSSARYRPPERLVIHTIELPAANQNRIKQQRYGFRPPTVSKLNTNRPSAAVSNAYIQAASSQRASPNALRAQGVVRATNPPPGPNDPPPPKTPKPVAPTYQIDHQLRKYRQQQQVDGRSAKQPPQAVYRNSAMHEVQAPNLKYRERPLRSQIQRLKNQQRVHFGVANDAHPATSKEAILGNDIIGPKDTKYAVYTKGHDLYRDQVNEFDSIRPTKSPDYRTDSPVGLQQNSKTFAPAPKNTLFRPSQPLGTVPPPPSTTPSATPSYTKHKFAVDTSRPSSSSGSHRSQKHKHESTASTTSGYEALRDSLNDDINAGLSAYRSNSAKHAGDKFHTGYDPLKYHSDPFDNQYYKNYLSLQSDKDDEHNDEGDGDDDNHSGPTGNYGFSKDNNDDDEDRHNDSGEYSDETDASSSHHYRKLRPSANFRQLQRAAPNFIRPVHYSTSTTTEHKAKANERADIGATTEIIGSSTESMADEFVPYRMLASVRLTERQIHRPAAEAGNGRNEPRIRAKIHEEGGHIVYSEQGYEDEQYDHGDEQREAVYKKITGSGFRPSAKQTQRRRRKRSTGNSEYPFYYVSRHAIPELSALRYSSAEGRRARQAERFYDTKRTSDCDTIEFDETRVIDDQSGGIAQKRRLRGLGDKLECMRRKYFGADPLSNPIFKELLVSDQTDFGATRKRRVRQRRETQRPTEDSAQKIIIPGASASASTSPAANETASSNQGGTSSTLEAPPLSSALVHTVPYVHEPPTVILLNERALARVRANPSMPLSDILGFPEIEQSEVFVFDIAKFVPRLFMSPAAQAAVDKSLSTGVEPGAKSVASATGRKRKYVRNALKSKRPTNHNYGKT